jgi:hypothetical protein
VSIRAVTFVTFLTPLPESQHALGFCVHHGLFADFPFPIRATFPCRRSGRKTLARTHFWLRLETEAAFFALLLVTELSHAVRDSSGPTPRCLRLQSHLAFKWR